MLAVRTSIACRTHGRRNTDGSGMDAANASENSPMSCPAPAALTADAVAEAVKTHPYLRSAEDGGDVLFALDAGLKYVHWNGAAEKLTGIPAREVIGRSLYEVFPDAAGSAAESLYLEVLRTARPKALVTQFEDTSYDVAAYPAQTGVLVVARDVTSQRARAPEGRRRDSLPLAWPGADAGVAVVSGGSILSVNARFAEMFGCSDADEPAGTSLLGFVCPEHRCYVGTLVRHAGIVGPAAAQLNLIGQRRDGSRFPVGVSGCSIPLPEGVASAIFFVNGHGRPPEPTSGREAGPPK